MSRVKNVLLLEKIRNQLMYIPFLFPRTLLPCETENDQWVKYKKKFFRAWENAIVSMDATGSSIVKCTKYKSYKAIQNWTLSHDKGICLFIGKDVWLMTLFGENILYFAHFTMVDPVSNWRIKPHGTLKKLWCQQTLDILCYCFQW